MLETAETARYTLTPPLSSRLTAAEDNSWSARARFLASTRRAERAEEASWAGLRPPSALTAALNRHRNSQRGRIATTEGYKATNTDTFRLTGQVCQMH